MKKIFAAIALFGVVFSVSQLSAKDAPYKEVSAEELTQMLDKGGIFLIDSRGGKYFDGEVIKGAVQLSAKKTNAETLGNITADKSANLVFYCSNTSCQASGFAAYKAADAGYTNLYKYPGGIEEWKEKGLPTTKLN